MTVTQTLVQGRKYTNEELAAVDVSHVPACTDVDSHEMLPIHLYESEFPGFGGIGKQLETMYRGQDKLNQRGANSIWIEEDYADDKPLTPENIWTTKGPRAPGIIDFNRRGEVMDAMGISQSLMFPTFTGIGQLLRWHPDGNSHFGFDMTGIDPRDIGDRSLAAYNTWTRKIVKHPLGDRVRPVGYMPADTIEQMMADAKEMIDAGIKAITLPLGDPPGGTSPADPALDDFWAMAAAANVPVTGHLGNAFQLFRSLDWSKNLPAYRPNDVKEFEFQAEPYQGMTLSFAPVNYLSTMILGGVFERHPTLRFGIFEHGAHWVGPFADEMDMWAREFAARVPFLKMKPSEYLVRNVRITPFVFENVKSYFDRYPHLSDVFCFSTDYPHTEGGRFAKQRFALNLQGVDQTVINKFFRDNGKLMLP